MKTESVEKALTAGYSTSTPASHAENLETVNPSEPSKGPEATAPAVEVKPVVEVPKVEEKVIEPVAEVKVEEVKAEVPKVEEKKVENKIAANLFKPFVLGATLRQGPNGNVIQNIKPSKFDYETQYKNSTKNIKISAEELAKLSTKGK